MEKSQEIRHTENKKEQGRAERKTLKWSRLIVFLALDENILFMESKTSMGIRKRNILCDDWEELNKLWKLKLLNVYGDYVIKWQLGK